MPNRGEGGPRWSPVDRSSRGRSPRRSRDTASKQPTPSSETYDASGRRLSIEERLRATLAKQRAAGETAPRQAPRQRQKPEGNVDYSYQRWKKRRDQEAAAAQERSKPRTVARYERTATQSTASQPERRRISEQVPRRERGPSQEQLQRQARERAAELGKIERQMARLDQFEAQVAGHVYQLQQQADRLRASGDTWNADQKEALAHAQQLRVKEYKKQQRELIARRDQLGAA